MTRGRRALRAMPPEFEEWLDAGKSQGELREKFVAGDDTINRWRDEIYIARAELVRKRRK